MLHLYYIFYGVGLKGSPLECLRNIIDSLLLIPVWIILQTKEETLWIESEFMISKCDGQTGFKKCNWRMLGVLTDPSGYQSLKSFQGSSSCLSPKRDPHFSYDLTPLCLSIKWKWQRRCYVSMWKQRQSQSIVHIKIVINNFVLNNTWTTYKGEYFLFYGYSCKMNIFPNLPCVFTLSIPIYIYIQPKLFTHFRVR